MRLEIAVSGFVRDEHGNPIPGEQLETLFDFAMEELIALGVENPAIEASGKDASFEVSVVVEEVDEEHAIAKAASLVRAAAHAAGLSTPNWPVRWYTSIDPRTSLVDA